jgi:hypothetical protein
MKPDECEFMRPPTSGYDGPPWWLFLCLAVLVFLASLGMDSLITKILSFISAHAC